VNPVVSQTDSFVNQLNWHTNQSTKALEQLAGGTRLQAPQDDAAGLAVATKLQAQLRQFNAAARNLAHATSFTQTQDGYLESAQDTLNRMGELAIRAQDATLKPDQRALYQTEFQALKDTFNGTRTAEYNGHPLFDGNARTVASSPDDLVQLPGVNLFTAEQNAVTAQSTRLDSLAQAQAALQEILTATDQLATDRAGTGSTLTELESAQARLVTQAEASTATFSRISDTDVNEVMTQLAREQSLTQNNLFALKQLNSNQSHLIDLLG
jgi:flagellin